jgi:glutaredoxin
MPRFIPRNALLLLAGLTIATTAWGQAQQVYRYTDSTGRVIYSDRVPPPDAKDVQPKRLSGNFIETDAVPLATREASERFPVTLYSFDCGELCQSAEGFLNKRGVPFTLVDVQQPDGSAKLKALTNEQTVPVLKVGERNVKGFNEARWNSILDEAGYSKIPAIKRAAAPRPVDTTPPRPVPSQSVSSVPQRGGDYPK